VTIDQTTFTGNGASARGGAIATFLAASTCTITSSFFQGANNANDGGAVYLSDGTLSMTGGEVSDNVARAGGGGGLFGQGTITIAGVNFYRNQASGNGGAILVNLPGTSSCTLQDCGFADNQCNTGGLGGVGPNVAYDGQNVPTVINCTGLNPNEPIHV
jgi:fibronectin-binding autotransporter adhesin